MERIGIAASKMAKGNIPLYNFYVVLISFLFSLFIFILAGCTVVFSLIVISYLTNEIASFQVVKDWSTILALCMISLSVITVLFMLIAISKNIKFPKSKNKI